MGAFFKTMLYDSLGCGWITKPFLKCHNYDYFVWLAPVLKSFLSFAVK